MLKLQQIEEEINPDIKGCKGLFWRAEVSTFLSNYQNGYNKQLEQRLKLRFLKRRSCKGCEQCDWLWNYLSEDPESFIDLSEIESGKVYTYKVHSSQGYYDLYPEIDEIEFIEVEK